MRKRLAIFLAVMAVLMAYTVSKALAILNLGAPAVALACVALFMAMFGYQFWHRARPEIDELPAFKALAYGSSVLLGAWATFVILELFTDAIKLILLTIDAALPMGFFGETLHVALRDEHTSSQINFYLVVLAAGAAAIGLVQALRGPRIVYVKVPNARFPKNVQPLRIAQISDLHVGATIGESYVRRVVALANSLQPDIVVLTGDIVDGNPGSPSVLRNMRPLESLRSPLGVFYATGNHEYYWNAPQIVAALTSLGIVALINENRLLDRDGLKILIAGVTDPAATAILPSQAPDLTRALHSPLASDIKLLLAHRPNVCIEAAGHAVDLQLSGHTHGGQFFPFSLLIPLAHKFSRGLHAWKDMQVYVSPGTGYWGPVNRFAIPAEVTLLELGPE